MNLTTATSSTILCVQISVNIIMLHLIMPFTTVLVIVLVEKQALRERPQFIFFTSLMINEVVVYVVRIIFIAVQLGNVPISSSACNVYQSLVSIYLANDFYSLAAMSIDRYIAICWPLKYNMILSPVRVRNAVITIALVAASGPFALFLAEEILAERHNPNMICTVDNVTLFKTGQMRVLYSVFRVCASSLVVVLSYILIYREGRRSGMFSVENKNARRSILYHGLQLSLFLLPTILLQVLAAFGRRIAITFQTYAAILMTHLVVFSVAQGLGLVIYGLRITHLRNSMCRVLGINRAAIGVHS